MRLSENSRKAKTHYEFVCYYEGKRVALIKQTLDELLKENAVKVIGWLVYHKINNVQEAWTSLTNTYTLSAEMQDKLFIDLIDYNNGEFDRPYAIEFVKVTSNGTVIERFPFKSEKNDIKSIIYQDYLDALSDKMFALIEDMISSGDIDLLLKDTCIYMFNGYEKYITFELKDYWTGWLRYCINEILMTENIHKIDSLAFDDDGIYFDTDNGLLMIPV